MQTSRGFKAATGVLLAALAGLLGVSAAATQSASNDDLATLRQAFDGPPDDARIMVRWWWFGPQVTDEELGRELQTMKDSGIGGVEIQPVYPVALDDAANGLKTEPFLSDAFLAHLRFATDRAAALGLRFDLTLGSGWPYGGPTVSIDHAAGRLRIERVPIPPQASRIALPHVGAGETFIAGEIVAPGAWTRLDPTAPVALSGASLDVAADMRPRELVVFISSRTGQMVKRAAVGAEGFVLDHYDADATSGYLSSVGARLLSAFGSTKPFAIFCDSLEVYESDWTSTFPAEFERRRGYDIRSHLLELASGEGSKAADVRHDWGQTLTELVDEHFIAPLEQWTAAHGAKLRAQVYGTPPASTSSATLVDLPEGEGADWRGLSATRWAASASHVKGVAVTSAETWTWLHSPAFAATPLDMKAEADRQFLQGANQLVGHGWPYSPPAAGSPGWRFYAAAALSDKNPWWIVMPDVARALQRTSALLRQGSPVVDVALYLPVDDAWADFSPGNVDLIEGLRKRVGPDVIPSILDAGFSFDVVDPKSLANAQVGRDLSRATDACLTVGTARYRAVVLPDVGRIPEGVQQIVDAFEKAGGVIVRSQRPGQALAAHLTPDVLFQDPAIGLVHRRVGTVDFYFVANTSNLFKIPTVHFSGASTGVAWWDPVSGRRVTLPVSRTSTGTEFSLGLPAYGSGFLVVDASIKSRSERGVVGSSLGVPYREMRFWLDDENTARKVALPHSWSAMPEYVHRSGIGHYEFEVGGPADARSHAWLDFDDSTPIPETNPARNGMRAWLDAPVRDVAVVYVNGIRAGAAWCPPYQVPLGTLLHRGVNTIRIDVANTAMNEMAGMALPDYRLLNLRYGTRFEAQDMDRVAPQPSGLLTSAIAIMWGHQDSAR
jgi:alpha-L-rhamnosidase